MATPKISIIIPVYNVRKYLGKCIDSLVAQTLHDIEIICVDDESPDNSVAIIEEYAKKDSRIKLISQKNTGASGARNAALKIAQGQYVLFVDGDDWIENDACELLYDIAIKNDTDVVMFACMLEYKNNTLNKFAFEQDRIDFIGSECEMLHRRHIGMIGDELAHPERQDFLCSACTKLYKRKIIEDNDINFPDIRDIGSYEDGIFNLYYYKFIKSSVYIRKPLYHYRKDNVDSNTSNYKPELLKQREFLYDLMEKYIKENGLNIDFSNALQNRIALEIIGIGLNIASAKISYFEKLKRVKKILSKPQYRQAVKQLETKYMPIHWKLFFAFAKINNAFAVYMLLAVMKKLRGRV